MPFYHNINPAIVHLGPLEIRWYGLFYLIGFGIAYLMLPWLAKKKGIKLSKQDASDYLSYVVLGVLIGGRLGYVIFYNLPYYLQNPLKVIAVWEGGMSFHGGLIGVVFAIWYFCRQKKMHFYDIGDLTAYPLALALALGRFGNLVNGELWGKLTDWSFCIDYSRSQYIANPPEGCRYPTQLLEVGKNLLIFGFLWPLRNKNLPRGFIMWTFITLYGILRFMIEFWKLPDEGIGYILGLTLGQWLCIPMFVIGGFMLYYVSKR